MARLIDQLAGYVSVAVNHKEVAMAIVRWDPWRDLSVIERRFDELLGRMGRGRFQEAASGGWMPAVDVHQAGNEMVIRAELAGVKPEDVDITVDDSTLHLSGSRQEDTSVEEGSWIRRERFAGRFQRDFSLPQGTDADAIKASCENGVVEIRVPLPQAEEPRHIPLETGGKREAIDVGAAKAENRTSA